MTYAAHHRDFAPCVGIRIVARRNGPATKPGILRRLYLAIMASRQRQTDREIARFIAQSGGRLTDDLERRIMERLTAPGWGGYRRG
jgi:hypothetical protein